VFDRPNVDGRAVRLAGSDGQAVALAVSGYQFPALREAEYDSNWLVIRVDVSHPRGAWQASDAALLTYEVARLADWLEAVESGCASEREIGFTEPNLELRVVDSGGRRKLRVQFDLELRPSWAPVQAAGAGDLWVEFDVSELNLRAAAADLRGQLERYPPRAPR
jgi:hypothetical protein